MHKKDTGKLNVRIINADIAHIPEIAAMEAEIFSMPWSLQSFRDVLFMEHVLFYAACDADRVVGYCICYLAADEGEIANIAVAPQYRRRGIAAMLLLKTIKHARERGAQRMFLEVRSRNEPAIRLYEGLSFQKTGIRRHYYMHPDDDALVMMHDFADK